MKAIHVAKMDKPRPVLVLTREELVPHMTSVTVAPITKTVKGLPTEVPVGGRNGINEEAVVSCDNITTIPKASLGKWLGFLMDDQEDALTKAIHHAFDLND